MDKETLREVLESRGFEDSIIFENPSYDTAIIGTTEDGQVCYSFNKMIEHLVEKDKMTVEDAIDFISYNTIRAVPYCYPSDKRPIIVYDDIE